MKKQPLLLLLSFTSSLSYGQVDGSNIFSSLSGFRNVGYQDNLFTNAEIGFGFLSNSRFSPELSIGYLGASPDIQTRIFNRDGGRTSGQQVRSQVKGLLLNVGLVTRLTKRESIWLYTLTNVSFASNTTFKARLFKGDNPDNLPLRETITKRDNSVFFNVGLGVEGFIDEEERSGSLTLVYTTFKVFDNFKDLKFDDFDTNLALPSNRGLGLRYLI